MAIDNLDAVCMSNGQGTNLNYQTTKFFPGLPECTDFESYIKRKPLAEKQLQVIGRYLKDYKFIIEKIDKTKFDYGQVQKMEDEDTEAFKF